MNILAIGEVSQYIKNCFAQDKILRSLYLRGEISNLVKHSSGHWYFTLKDDSAVIRAVLFRNQVQRLGFSLTNGMRIIAGGQITIFERSSNYQINIAHVIPDGAGDLHFAYEQLKQKLENEGLFSQEYKKSLPLLPRKIGVITSPTGAVIRDIRKVAHRRFPGLPLILFPVTVQGEKASVEIAHALHYMNCKKMADVIIIGRGGGSLEELWAFNTELVVRAVFSSNIPIISAVGHETDVTLTDFAADCRAATPSQAAELAVPQKKELQNQIMLAGKRLQEILNQKLEKTGNDVRFLQEKLRLLGPEHKIQHASQLLDMWQLRLQRSVNKTLQEKQLCLSLLQQKLEILDPEKILQRGYSVVRGETGTIFTDAQALLQTEKFEIILSKGRVWAQVLKEEGE